MTDEERVELITQIANNFGISCDDASYIIKSFENFGKEQVMLNIEDDVNVLGVFCLAGRIEIISPEEFEEVKIAIRNILSEREQDKSRIKELEEKNRMLALEGSRVRLDLYIKGNYIPKQKIKEILDKAEVMDYYTLPDVIDDLTKLLEAEDE